MYEYLCGDVVARDNGAIVLDVGQVAYRLLVSTATIKAVAGSRRARLYTELRLRDENLVLYGFATNEERQVFRKICSVAGVGPATALGVLSELTLDELRTAVLSRQPKVLDRVRGVGKKLAERMTLELRHAFEAEGATAPDTSQALVGAAADATAVLVGLEYPPLEAERAVRQALEEFPAAASFQQVFMKAQAILRARDRRLTETL